MTELGRLAAAEHWHRVHGNRTVAQAYRVELARALGLAPTVIARIDLRGYPATTKGPVMKGATPMSGMTSGSLRQAWQIQDAFDGEAFAGLRRWTRDVIDLQDDIDRLARRWPNDADSELTDNLRRASRQLDEVQDELHELQRTVRRAEGR